MQLKINYFVCWVFYKTAKLENSLNFDKFKRGAIIS